MARLEVRALTLLRGRNIRGGAFQVAWGALLAVVALLAFGAAFGASNRAEAPHTALGAQHRALQASLADHDCAALLSAPAVALAYCEHALDVSPTQELTALEWEDLEDDARPDPIVVGITARLASLLAIDVPQLRPRAALPASQLCGSTALPRGPPAHI